MSKLIQRSIATWIFAFIIGFFIFSSTVLAAKVGDKCDPAQDPPGGYTCQCNGNAQSASCTLVTSSSDPSITTASIDAPCTLQTGNPFFGFPHWWQYLKGHVVEDSISGKQCVPTLTGINDIWAVLLAIINILLRLAGIVAVFAAIFSGAQYILAGGNPEKAVSARWRLYNSLIGLGIVAVATAVVAFIGNYLLKP